MNRVKVWGCAASAWCGVLAAILAGCHANPALIDGGSAGPDRLAEAYRLSREAQNAQRNRDTDRAVELYGRAVELQPDMPGVWNNLGVLFMEQQRYLDAVMAFKRESEIVPADPRPFENLGLAYYERGLPEESLRYYSEALKRDPNRVESLRGLARVSRQRLAADEDISMHMRRALLVERDPAWLKIFESERVRVDNQLREEKESGRSAR